MIPEARNIQTAEETSASISGSAVKTKPNKQEERKNKYGPDSWEGWRMVIYCFANTFLLGGSTRSAAVLYVAVMETFNVDRGEAAWPISLITGFVNFSGILSGPLSTKLGLRVTCIIGGCVSCICLGLCYFANNIMVLTILFGILNGIGIGLMYNLNPVILTHYFKKYKSIALGINYTGSTIAAMVFPKFMEFLYFNFGLHRLFLIFAGIMLVAPVMSSFMHRPSWRKKKMQAPNISQEIVRRLTLGSIKASSTTRSRANTATKEPSQSIRSRTTTMRSHAGSITARERTRSTSINVMRLNIGTQGKEEPDFISAMDVGMGVLPHSTIDDDFDESCASPLDEIKVREEQSRPQNRLTHLQVQIPTLSATVDHNKGADLELNEVSEALEEERELSLTEIFCNPLFYLLIVSYLMFCTYTDILITVMVDLLTDKGVDQSTAIATIPLISVTDMAGRLLLPFLVDKGLIDRKVIFSINYFCLGGLSLIIPLFRDYSILIGLFLLVGWFYGSTIVMCTVIVCDLLGVHNLAVANGLIYSSAGLIAFGRPALIG
ncbi:monocarboxylate transporter 9-like [Tropilaelaps mercedesae]|uniref:Monocarboxylate transporter 9-like n=1 Tax=Tropilaelaps mercedesae TaxID=418985 RepID=A0A1V9XKH4_9ACAR|nr:monocarboxylate transporter 9-like [Tropilaelaps mercedesae]